MAEFVYRDNVNDDKYNANGVEDELVTELVTEFGEH